ncbi:MAG: hypothetical protein ACRDPH_07410 [Marmoricola sp.]
MTVAAALVLALVGAGPAANHHADPAGRIVCRIHDPRITEASSLVDLGRWMVTADDSGSGPVLYLLDARTGRTVGTTTYADAVTDVEALAPAGHREVWVGDIGDNTRSRPAVSVYRAPVGPGHRTVRAPRFDLTYPDGSHDAEALVADRGRLFVVTKAFLGAAVYNAPRQLSTTHPNRMRRVADAPPIVTDAALLPDHRHALLRNYAEATVVTFPGMRRVGSFPLPRERQGEAVSVGRQGRVRVTSEGTHPAVISVAPPPRMRAAFRPHATADHPRASPSKGTAPSRQADKPGKPAPHGSPWPLIGLGVVVVAAAYGLRRLRRRLVRRDRER